MPPVSDDDLPRLSREVRLEGRTIRELARAAGVPYERAGRILRGDRPGKPEERERLRAAIGRALDEVRAC